MCSSPDSISEPDLEGLTLGASVGEAPGKDHVTPLLLMSNLATEEDFVTERGNQLIVDILPATECVQ